MIDDWQEMDDAPLGEDVLVCSTNCKIVVAYQKEYEGHVWKENGPSKVQKMKGWFMRGTFDGNSNGGEARVENVKMWRHIPLPPKHLYERKLTADLLEKQVKELRS